MASLGGTRWAMSVPQTEELAPLALKIRTQSSVVPIADSLASGQGFLRA